MDGSAISRTMTLVVAARSRHSHDSIADSARAEIESLRSDLAAGRSIDLDSIATLVLARLERDAAPRLRTVINATGIVLHTNLGRSPLHETAARAAYDAARGYLNLELDLATGQRGSRQDSIRDGIRAITGAEWLTIEGHRTAQHLQPGMPARRQFVF